MGDYTVTERMRRYRKRRMEKGWKEVKILVPSRSDAIEIKRIAADMRKRALRDEKTGSTPAQADAGSQLAG